MISEHYDHTGPVPILKQWKRNPDDTITGFIHGSAYYTDGEWWILCGLPYLNLSPLYMFADVSSLLRILLW